MQGPADEDKPREWDVPLGLEDDPAPAPRAPRNRLVWVLIATQMCATCALIAAMLLSLYASWQARDACLEAADSVLP